MNTARPSRPMTTPRARSRNPAAICRRLTSGKREAKAQKVGPRYQANSSAGQKGNDSEYRAVSCECQVSLWTLFRKIKIFENMPATRDAVAPLSRFQSVKTFAALFAVPVQGIF